jgi:hypothetical protein
MTAASHVVTTSGSRDEYARRMHRVLEAIDRHLDQALGLARLAAVAHYPRVPRTTPRARPSVAKSRSGGAVVSAAAA